MVVDVELVACEESACRADSCVCTVAIIVIFSVCEAEAGVEAGETAIGDVVCVDVVDID